MRLFHIIPVLIILLSACQSEDNLITGTVAGRVVALSSYNKYLPNQEGLKVNLYRDSVVFSTVLTNSLGRFYFKGVPYGRYFIKAYKEKFVSEYFSTIIKHAGGPSPTMQDAGIWEIPTYQVIIDSLDFDLIDHRFILFIRSDTIIPTNSIRAFADSVGDVTKDKYVSAGNGYFTNYHPNYPSIAGVCGIINQWDFDKTIEKLKSDTIYLRIYPIAGAQGKGIMQFYPEALGKPSNVVKFLWDDLVQNKK